MKKWVEIEHVRENGDKFSEGTRSEITKSGAVLGSLMSDMLNNCCSGDNEKDMITYLTHEHPTIQQKFFSFVLKAISEFAEKDCYDGRNEDSVKKAKRIKEFMESEGLGMGCPLI